MSEVPQSPSDERPNGEPYFIDSTCDCGNELEPFDDTDWNDEWACPDCDGIYMDWPESEFEKLEARVDDHPDE